MTVFFSGISFWWAIGVLGLVFAVTAVWTLVARKRLRVEAAQEWAYRVEQNMQDLRLDEAGFVRAYTKVNAPRRSAHFAVGAGLILALTPIFFSLINAILYGFWEYTDRSRVFEPGYMVWAFMIFFSLIGVWAMMAALVARNFHAKSPGLMRDEVLEERENFIPDQDVIMRPNPVHILADLKDRQNYQQFFGDALECDKTTIKNWHDKGHMVEHFVFKGTNEMGIFVHYEGDQRIHEDCTSLFYTRPHAREASVPVQYRILVKRTQMAQDFDLMIQIDLECEISRGQSRTMRQINHQNLEIYLYQSPSSTDQ